MANDRLQVQTSFARENRQSNLEPENIPAVASPVDQFSPPRSGDQLDQLARALAPLSQDVAQYSSVVARKNEEHDKAEAEANVSAAVRSGAKTYADAVKSGAIPAAASPYYRMYAKRQFGQLAAGRMQSDFQAASQNALAHASSLAEFDEFAKTFQADWLQQNAGSAATDISFNDGFNPHANAVIAQERQQFAERVGKQLQADTASALAQNQTQLILNGKRAGLSDAQITEQLNAATQAAFEHGVTGDVLTQINALAITNSAEQLLDSTVLGLAGKVKSGTGVLEGTLEWNKERGKSLPFILENNSRLNSVEREQKKEAREKAVNETLFNAFDAFSKSSNPANVDIRPYITQLRSAGGSVSDEERLLGLQKIAGTRRFDGDEAVFTQAYADAIDPDGAKISTGAVHGLVLNRRLSFEQANRVLAALRERQAADDAAGAKAIPKEPYYKLSFSALKTTFSFIDPSGINKVALSNAMVEFDRRYRELHDTPAWANGDKSAMAEKIRDDIMRSPMMPQAIRSEYEKSMKPGFSSQAKAGVSSGGSSFMSDLARRVFKEQKSSPNGKLSDSTMKTLKDAGVTDLRQFYIDNKITLPQRK